MLNIFSDYWLISIHQIWMDTLYGTGDAIGIAFSSWVRFVLLPSVSVGYTVITLMKNFRTNISLFIWPYLSASLFSVSRYFFVSQPLYHYLTLQQQPHSLTIYQICVFCFFRFHFLISYITFSFFNHFLKPTKFRSWCLQFVFFLNDFKGSFLHTA